MRNTKSTPNTEMTKNTKNSEDLDNSHHPEEMSKISVGILTENFATLARAKGGIPKLRETILQLAVQGRLVPQDPADEPASVLLERIQKEKARLVKEKTFKKAKALPPVDADEVPYVLPEGWVWTKLNEIVTKIGSGSTPRGGKSVYQDNGIPFIRSQNVWNEGLRLESVAYIPIEIHQNMSATFVNPKDILLNITGASIGRSSLVSEDFCEGNVSQHVSIIRSVDENVRYFLHLVIISPYFQKMIMDQQVGISREGLSKKMLEQFIVPLPPLPEQHRIVERVDTLMALCDELEARQDAEAKRRRMLLESVLHALQDGTDPEGVAAAREIFAANFDLLVDDTESIADLRKTILQLAVQGRLVEQDPADEPASVLLERISAEKARLVKEKKIKKAKGLPPVDADEVPYALPEGWVWTRLGNIIDLISGQHIQKSDYHDSPRGIPYITGPIDFGEQYPIISKWTDKPKSISKENNILVTVKGAGLGKCNLVNLPELAISRQLMAIHCIGVDFRFIFIFIKSNYDYFQRKGVGIAIPGISREDVTSIPLSLPPLPEQHRIVERVDTLMALCDELDARVRAQEDAAERLLASVCDGICG